MAERNDSPQGDAYDQDLDRDNRQHGQRHTMADLAGYRYQTARGRTYDFVDLSDETLCDVFPPHSVLRGRTLSRRWVRADFRISFAKNKTDEANAFA